MYSSLSQFITIYRLSVCLSVCLSALNSKFTTIEGFWVQFLQKSKVEIKKGLVSQQGVQGSPAKFS